MYLVEMFPPGTGPVGGFNPQKGLSEDMSDPCTNTNKKLMMHMGNVIGILCDPMMGEGPVKSGCTLHIFCGGETPWGLERGVTEGGGVGGGVCVLCCNMQCIGW